MLAVRVFAWTWLEVARISLGAFAGRGPNLISLIEVLEV
jgi:hypothetical protein